MQFKIHTNEIIPLKLAGMLLAAVKDQSPTSDLIEQLGGLGGELLLHSLAGDEKKAAFWINIYNSFNLIQLREAPAVDTQAKARHFFGRNIVVAGRSMSLNDIEHRILRVSKRWWGRGRYQRWEAGRWERANRLEKLDPRVHFALNCGAESCPPIYFYDAQNIDLQLEIATKSFLLGGGLKEMEDAWVLSGIFRMYIHDFGGEKGLRDFLLGYLPDSKSLLTKQLRFIPFNSSPKLDAFVG
jgi:hypothetical protein